MTSDNKSKYQVHLPSGRWLLSPPRIYAKTFANSSTTSSPLNPTMNFIQKYQPWFSSGHKTFLCDASKFWGQIKPQLNLFRHHNIMFQASSNYSIIPTKFSGHIRNFFYWSENFQTWSKNASFSTVLLDHSSEGRFRRKQKRRNKTLLGWAVVWYLGYVAKEFILVITNAQEMGVRRAVKRRSWKNNVTRNFCPMRQGTLTQP